MILIVGPPDDAHIQAVKTHLDEHGHEVCFLSTRNFTPSTISLTSRSGKSSLLLLDGTKKIPLDEIETVWLRRTPQTQDYRQYDSKDDARFARAEVRHLMNSVWPVLADRRWMNSYQARTFAECKPNQIRVAAELGILVPDSLITDSPEAALDFCRDHGGDIIYKALTWFNKDIDDKSYMIYTNRLNEALLRSKLGHIKQAPCLFQEYVSKKFELRAVVVGDRIFAVSFDSQASPFSSVDWRRYDFDNVAHKQHALPDEVAQQLHRLMRELGLVFGCIDLIVTPEGKYVFLEVNEAGNWMWLDILANTTISRAIADYLCGHSNVLSQPI